MKIYRICYQYFPQHLLLGQLIFEYILHPNNFLKLSTSFLYIRVSSLLPPLNDASSDIIDDEGSFQFSTKAEFTSPLYVHITFAAELKHNHRASHNFYSVQNTLKLTI